MAPEIDGQDSASSSEVRHLHGPEPAVAAEPVHEDECGIAAAGLVIGERYVIAQQLRHGPYPVARGMITPLPVTLVVSPTGLPPY